MDVDDGPLDLVPPSPIASSTQLPRSLTQNQNLPPLPQLFLPGSPNADRSRSDLSPIATSTQQPGSSLLSPIATSTQQPGSSRTLFSPVAATQQPGNLRTLTSPIATSTQQPESSRSYLLPRATVTQQPGNPRHTVALIRQQGSARSQLRQGIISRQQPRSSGTLPRNLTDWVINVRTSSSTDTQGSEVIQAERHHVEVRVGDSDDDDDVIEIEEAEGEVSVTSGESDAEEVVDSDEDSVSEENGEPALEEQAGVDTDEQPADTSEAQNNTLVEQEEVNVGQDNPEPRPTEEQGPEGAPESGQEPHPGTSGLLGTPGSTLHVQALPVQRESPADFRSPKRRRVISPAKSSAKEGEKEGEDEEAEDSECCPICFEPWTTSGNHRLCSLKCGHLFGQSCIDKWLKGQGGKCPHCNAKAKRQDIRVIYAKSIRALDTSEKDRALKDLEKEKEARRKAEMEAAELRLKYQKAMEDNNILRSEMERLRQNMKLAGGGAGAVGSVNISQRNPNEVLSNSQVTGRFIADKVIKIWDAGNCRVMAYCPPLATLIVSQPSASPLFPGFGVKKISTLDFKTSQYMTVHSKAIRDISFHPSDDNGMLLSCGLDKKVKMTNLLSNAVVQSYDTPMPAWSCVWNADDRNYFYTGLQNGLILEFDIRNTDGFVQEINSGGSRSPVAALKYMPKNLQATFSAGGLLIGQLDRVQFFESLPSNHYRPHILPLDGSLTSLYVDPSTRHVLASFRPTARNPTVRHQLCEMVWHNVGDASCSCNVVYTFHGGKTQTVLSRTLLIKHPGDNNRLLVCAGDEKDSSVHVYDSGSGQKTQSLPMGGITVDTCSLVANQQVFLGALTEKKLCLYRWC